MALALCPHVPLHRRSCYVACMVAMGQLQTHTPLTFYQVSIGKDGRRTSQHTFAVNKRQPIDSYIAIA
jgi:hypothetical protein